MSRMKLFTATGLFVLAAIAASASAQTEDAVAQELIALTQAEWAALDKNDIQEAAKNWDKEFTQFNPTFATRIDGRAQIIKLEQATASARAGVPFSEMGNAKVQVYGDVAILSYNYLGMTKDDDGNTEPVRAKSTRVYVNKGGSWKLVHANFGADPRPE